MHIGLVIYGNINTISGGYFYDRKLVKFLRQAGDKVEIISIPQGTYLQNVAESFSKNIIRLIGKNDFDILLEDELCHATLFRINRKLRRHYPIISIVHHLRSSEPHPWHQKIIYRMIEKRFLSSVDGHITVSRHTRATVRRLLGAGIKSVTCPPGRDHIKPDIDIDFIRRRAAGQGPLRVLFVGNIIPRKGLHNLIEAISRLDGACKLAIVGSRNFSPVYVGQIERQIETLKIADAVAWLGPLSKTGLAAQLRQAQVLAVPSEHEGYGIAYLEGLGYGLPVIAGAKGGTREIFRHKKEGFFMAGDDIDSLAFYLERLCNDRRILLQMGLAAYERFWKLPTWDENLERARGFMLSTLSKL